jgi:uncharacterized protein
VETLFRKTAAFISSYHKIIVLAFALLTAVSVYIVFHMEIRTDIIDVLPKGNKAVMRFKEFIENYGALDNVTIMIEPEGGSVDESIDLIETLAVKLKKSPFIEYVDYGPQVFKSDIFFRHFPLFLDSTGLEQLGHRLSPRGIERQIRLDRQQLISPFSSPLDTELIPRDPLKISEIVAESMKRANRDSLDMSAGYYFTKDHSAAFLFVKPRGKSKDMAFVEKFKQDIDSIIASSLKETNNTNIRIELAGTHILAEEISRIIRHDVVYSFVLSAVLIALSIWLAYRVRLAVIAAIGFTLLASLSMTLVSAYFIFGSLNIVTSVVATLLIGLYVDYSINMMKRYGDELRKRKDSRSALEIMLTKTGATITASGLTTSLSFFSIIITKFEGLHELGITAGIGVILCLVTNLFLMSSLLLWTSGNKIESIQPDKEPSLGIEWLIRLVTRHPGPILVSGIVFVVILGFGIVRLTFDNDPEHFGTKDSQAVAAILRIKEKLGKTGDPLNIIMKSGAATDLASSFDSSERLMFQWQKDGLIGRYDSLGIFLPPPYTQRMKLPKLQQMATDLSSKDLEEKVIRSLEINGITYDKKYVGKYLAGIVAALDSRSIVGLRELATISDPRVNYFYNKKDLSLAAYLYPAGKEWDRPSLEALQSKVRASGNNWFITGKPILFSEIKASVIQGSALATVATLFVNLAIIFWFYKETRYVFFVMLPVTAGCLLTPGIMGYLNSPFNFINIGTIAMIFGFGVDYGIYIVQAYLREETKDVANALRISGKNVMMCAATTIAGCGSLIIARFAGLASIGVVLTIGAIACAVISLVLLPALLCLNQGSQ